MRKESSPLRGLGQALFLAREIVRRKKEPLCVIASGSSLDGPLNGIYTDMTINRTLPKGCTVVSFGGKDFTLLAKWDGEKLDWLSSGNGQKVDFGRSTSDIYHLHPWTIITRDGRFYHDLESTKGQSREELADYFTQLAREFGRNRKP